MRLVASLERGSEHPLAAAIVEAARGERHVTDVRQTNSVAHRPRRGRHASADMSRRSAMTAAAKSWTSTAQRADARRPRSCASEGQTVIFAAVDGRAAGLLGVADPVKPEAPQAIRELRAEGLRVVMLTGDNATTADAGRRASSASTNSRPTSCPTRKPTVVKKLQAAGTHRGHGRRRHQRRSGAGPGPGRHRHGHRHRRRHGKRRRHPVHGDLRPSCAPVA